MSDKETRWFEAVFFVNTDEDWRVVNDRIRAQFDSVKGVIDVMPTGEGFASLRDSNGAPLPGMRWAGRTVSGRVQVLTAQSDDAARMTIADAVRAHPDGPVLVMLEEPLGGS